MSLLGKLIPAFASPEQKLEKARKHLARNSFNEARWAVDGLDSPEAEELRQAALGGMAELNLKEAEALYRLGDEDGARTHIEMAASFGASPAEIKAVRRAGRQLRAERDREEQEKHEAIMAKKMAVEGGDDLWALPPDDPRIRYAMQIEGYPEDLRERLVGLGPELADAVLKIDTEDPKGAVKDLGRFVDREPVVRFERARASLEDGNPVAAAADLLVFGAEVGHQRIGQFHTGVMLLGALRAQGRVDEALEQVEAMLKAGPDELELRAHRALLLEQKLDYEGAETELRTLVKKAPRDMGIQRMLARVLIAQGQREPAANHLETALDRCCGSPGSCGNQKLDINAVRMLARLYLEDRARPDRVRELMGELQRNVPDPSWEDQYLQLLDARNQGDPTVADAVKRLRAALSPGDPRQEWVTTQFAAQLT